MANRAAYLKSKQQHPLVVEDAPMPTPGPSQVVIKTRALAINPADAIIQSTGILIDTFPAILGFDIVGEIVSTGSAVQDFKLGDRVCGVSDSDLGNGSFQLFCAVDATGVAVLPENVSFEQGAVVPVGLCVAGVSLFQQDCLALPLPPLEGRGEANGKVVLVWGGASTVGSCAIQLAKAAGFEVAATSSERNFEYCRSLGASQVFDYKSASVVEEVVAACRSKASAGVFAAYLHDESLGACSKIASALGGKKTVATVIPPGMPLPGGLAEDVKVAFSRLSLQLVFRPVRLMQLQTI